MQQTTEQLLNNAGAKTGLQKVKENYRKKLEEDLNKLFSSSSKKEIEEMETVLKIQAKGLFEIKLLSKEEHERIVDAITQVADQRKLEVAWVDDFISMCF